MINGRTDISPLPPELSSWFDETLSRHEIPVYQRPHYRKWLRFYLNFCAKSGHRALERTSVRAFLRKLAEKGQDDWMRKQAVDAVRLYFAQCGEAGEHRDARDSDGISRPQAPSASARARRAEAQLTSTERRIAETPPIYAEPLDRIVEEAGQKHAGVRQQTAPQAAAPDQSATGGSTYAPTDSPPERSAAAAQSAVPANWPALYARIASEIKLRHYSCNTLKSYLSWVRKLEGFTEAKPPASLTVEDVKAFLTHLAADRHVSTSSQNQAFNALLFVFRHALGKEFGMVDGVVRAKKRPSVPVVLSRDEVARLLALLAPPFELPAQLLYGCGLRLFECLKLRVQDVNLEMGEADGPRRQGRQGSDRAAAGALAAVAEGSARDRGPRPPRRSCGWICRHLSPGPFRADVAVGGDGARLAMALPGGQVDQDPRYLGAASLSPLRDGPAKGAQGGGAGVRDPKAGLGPYPEAQLCLAPASGQLRHPHDPRAAGP